MRGWSFRGLEGQGDRCVSRGCAGLVIRTACEGGSKIDDFWWEVGRGSLGLSEGTSVPPLCLESLTWPPLCDSGRGQVPGLAWPAQKTAYLSGPRRWPLNSRLLLVSPAEGLG